MADRNFFCSDSDRTLPGMNGNNSDGVLEGLVHFLPHTRKWLKETP